MRPCKPWTHPEPGGCSESSWCRIKRLCPLSVCLYLVLLLLLFTSSFRAGEAGAALKGSGSDPKGNEQVRAVLPSRHHLALGADKELLCYLTPGAKQQE